MSTTPGFLKQRRHNADLMLRVIENLLKNTKFKKDITITEIETTIFKISENFTILKPFWHSVSSSSHIVKH